MVHLVISFSVSPSLEAGQGWDLETAGALFTHMPSIRSGPGMAGKTGVDQAPPSPCDKTPWLSSLKVNRFLTWHLDFPKASGLRNHSQSSRVSFIFLIHKSQKSHSITNLIFSWLHRPARFNVGGGYLRVCIPGGRVHGDSWETNYQEVTFMYWG